MPIGTLAEALLFLIMQPEHKERQAGVKVPIGKIIHAQETASWSEQLPGEQQRVAFARVFLHKPDWYG